MIDLTVLVSILRAGPRHVYPLRENAFPEVDVPWNAGVLLVPRDPQAPPHPQQRLVPVQQRVHAIEQQNTVVSK